MYWKYRAAQAVCRERQEAGSDDVQDVPEYFGERATFTL